MITGALCFVYIIGAAAFAYKAFEDAEANTGALAPGLLIAATWPLAIVGSIAVLKIGKRFPR